MFPHISCVLFPEHTCYDRYSLSSKYYEPHAFYGKHFWCFCTFRTKNIHIYLVCCCSALLLRSIFLFERYSLSSKNYEPHAYHLLLAAHTCYDRYFFLSQFYSRHFLSNQKWNPIQHLHSFSRALRRLHVTNRVLIGTLYCLCPLWMVRVKTLLWFHVTQLKTALIEKSNNI